MDYAKKYNNIVNILQSLIDDGKKKGHIIIRIEDLENAIPELKESEDEIKNTLITKFKEWKLSGDEDETWYGLSYDSVIAWLEKQGEQKPTDEIEPNFNFKAGQWIVATGKCVYLITKIDGFDITLVDTNGEHYVFDVSSLEDAREWTIQDAKDGDVLIDAFDSPFIYAGCTDKYAKCYIAFYTHHEYSGLTDFSSPQNWEDKNYVHPATKEQRNLLFAKMKEAGYEWNAETKQITKEESTDKEKQLDADIDLYYQTYGNGNNAFDGLSLEKFRDIVKQFINDYR